jgi:thiamine-phosphate pyrophosphorylase
VLSGAEFDALGPESFARVVSAGVDWVQVRERGRQGRALLALVDEMLRATKTGAQRAGRHTQLLVNRRVDVALASGADGVHLGFDGMPAAEARRLLGEAALLGVACHSPGEVDAAPDASYVHLAPIFAPLSKAPSRPALGLDALAEAALSRRCVLAQGGITPDNAGACVTAGAAGVAVTGTILGADDPLAATAALRAALDT